MFQQNQNVKIDQGSIIQAPTPVYPLRSFKLLEQLGKGSEGFVYKAIPQNQGSFQNVVALKFQTQIKEGVKQFYQQIIEQQNKYKNENSSNNGPSNIIKIYDCFDFSNYLVTVMELGQNDLYQYMELNKNKLTLQEKQSICLQILSSIVFLHSQNLFHRDIKPDNYLMVGQQVKLIDFGLIKQSNDDQKRLTLFAGIPYYQAPEVFEGKSDYTMAVDVWAMAHLFYEIIKGERLFNEVITIQELEKEIQQYKRDQSIIYNKISQLQISDEWKQTIKKMIHPDPKQRINGIDIQNSLCNHSIQKQIVFENQTNQHSRSTLQIKTGNNPSVLDQMKAFTQTLQSPFITSICQNNKEQIINQLVQLKNVISNFENKLMNQLQIEFNQAQDLKQNFVHQDPKTLYNKIKQLDEQIQEALKGKKAQEKLELSQNQLQELKKLNFDYENLLKANLKVEKKIMYQKELKKKKEKLQEQIFQNNNKIINQNQIKELEDEIQKFEIEILKQEVQIEKKNKLQNEIKTLQEQQKINQEKLIQTKNQNNQTQYENLKKQNDSLQNQLIEFEQYPNKIQKIQTEISDMKAKIQLGESYKNELNALTKQEQDLKTSLIDFEQIKKAIQEKRQVIEDLKLQKFQNQQSQEQLKQLDDEQKDLQKINKLISK